MRPACIDQGRMKCFSPVPCGRRRRYPAPQSTARSRWGAAAEAAAWECARRHSGTEGHSATPPLCLRAHTCDVTELVASCASDSCILRLPCRSCPSQTLMAVLLAVYRGIILILCQLEAHIILSGRPHLVSQPAGPIRPQTARRTQRDTLTWHDTIAIGACSGFVQAQEAGGQRSFLRHCMSMHYGRVWVMDRTCSATEAHLMGSCSWTSLKVRPMPAVPCPSCPFCPLLSLAPSLLSCCMSFRDSDRPVPSYLRTKLHDIAARLDTAPSEHDYTPRDAQSSICRLGISMHVDTSTGRYTISGVCLNYTRPNRQYNPLRLLYWCIWHVPEGPE